MGGWLPAQQGVGQEPEACPPLPTPRVTARSAPGSLDATNLRRGCRRWTGRLCAPSSPRWGYGARPARSALCRSSGGEQRAVRPTGIVACPERGRGTFHRHGPERRRRYPTSPRPGSAGPGPPARAGNLADGPAPDRPGHRRQTRSRHRRRHLRLDAGHTAQTPPCSSRSGGRWPLPADRPSGQQPRPVRIQLRVRRFVCTNPHCPVRRASSAVLGEIDEPERDKRRREIHSPLPDVTGNSTGLASYVRSLCGGPLSADVHPRLAWCECRPVGPRDSPDLGTQTTHRVEIERGFPQPCRRPADTGQELAVRAERQPADRLVMPGYRRTQCFSGGDVPQTYGPVNL